MILLVKNVEVIAFSTDDTEKISAVRPDKRTIEEAITFYTKYSVDFSKLEKWNRKTYMNSIFIDSNVVHIRKHLNYNFAIFTS